MLNKLVPTGEYILYRKVIWIYLFLLIFEGALRKWFLPALSTPLLLVRDPIVIWLVVVGMRKGWLKNNYVMVMMFAATVSLLLTMAIGHRNLSVALFGWRVYFFYFPFIFVIGKLLTREDLLKMGKFVLYLSIPMTLLVAVQFYSPQSAWINQGVGGDTEGSGFAGALGYFRPSGMFSFITGYCLFQLVVVCFLVYYLLMNKSLPKSHRIKPWLVWVMIACYLISIPISISRTHFFQTMVVVSFLFMVVFLNSRFNRKIIQIMVFVIFAGVVILFTGIANENIENMERMDSIAAFSARLDNATTDEGGMVSGTLGSRYLGSFIRGVYNDNLPFLGYYLGEGTNVGAKLVGHSSGFVFGEDEWESVTGECGLLIGWIIIGIRCLFSFVVLKKTFRLLQKQNDLLPWLLSAGMLLNVPQGNMGVPTNLGFLVLLGGFALAAVNVSDKKL